MTMSQRARVDAALSEYAQACGLGTLALDSDGHADIEVDGVAITLSFAETPAELLFCVAAIAPVEDGDDDTPRVMLEIGFSTWMKGVMTIGLDAAGSEILGYVAIPPARLDAATLAGTADQMAQTALQIRHRLAAGAAHDPGTDTQEPPRTGTPIDPQAIA
jgi:hypothetical protein